MVLVGYRCHEREGFLVAIARCHTPQQRVAGFLHRHYHRVGLCSVFLLHLTHGHIAVVGTRQGIDTLTLCRHTYRRLHVDYLHQVRVGTHEGPQPASLAEGVVITFLVPLCQSVVRVVLVVVLFLLVQGIVVVHPADPAVVLTAQELLFAHELTAVATARSSDVLIGVEHHEPPLGITRVRLLVETTVSLAVCHVVSYLLRCTGIFSQLRGLCLVAEIDMIGSILFNFRIDIVFACARVFDAVCFSIAHCFSMIESSTACIGNIYKLVSSFLFI